jgi:hypothetical protein
VIAANHPPRPQPGLAAARLSGRTTAEYGVRHLLEPAMRGRSHGLSAVIEADSFELMRRYVVNERAFCFQIPIGLRPGDDPRLVVRKLD